MTRQHILKQYGEKLQALLVNNLQTLTVILLLVYHMFAF